MNRFNAAYYRRFYIDAAKKGQSLGIFDNPMYRSGLALVGADRTFRGVVDKIEPQAVVEQNVTMFPVIVSIDNRSGLLRPGMNAEVEIEIDEALDVVMVPNNAIVQASDVGPAAMALGLDIEALDLSAFMRAGRGGFGGRPGGAGGGRPGGAGGQNVSIS